MMKDKTAAVRNGPARRFGEGLRKQGNHAGAGHISSHGPAWPCSRIISMRLTQVMPRMWRTGFSSAQQRPLVWHGCIWRDIFARVVHGARISIIIGLAATVGSVCISGIPVPLPDITADLTDNVIMRVLDTFLAIPGEL